MSRVVFDIEEAFGEIGVRTVDGRPEHEVPIERRLDEIPIALIERPEVLRALLILAERGGKKALPYRGNFELVAVDTDRTDRLIELVKEAEE